MAALQGGYLLAQADHDVTPVATALDMAITHIESLTGPIGKNNYATQDGKRPHHHTTTAKAASVDRRQKFNNRQHSVGAVRQPEAATDYLVR
jgi:TetR/AcrR family transcriptional repressor of nem operon